MRWGGDHILSFLYDLCLMVKRQVDEGTFLFTADKQVINGEGMIELGHPHFAILHEIMELGSR